jgi:insulysin
MSGESETETVRSLSKNDVLSFLMAYVHPDSPTRSKISVHLCSQKFPSPRVSLRAAHVLLERFKAVGIPVKEAEFNAAARLQLPTDVHQTAWRDYFEKDDPTFDKRIAAELVDLIAKVAKQYPVEGDSVDGKLKEGAVYIDNMAALRSRLTLGPAAVPIETYSDLSGSKL